MFGEQKVKVNAYKVKYFCDCSNEMKRTGEVLLSNPPKYNYYCDNCGETEIFDKKYLI